jgi:hypothetical protein
MGVPVLEMALAEWGRETQRERKNKFTTTLALACTLLRVCPRRRLLWFRDHECPELPGLRRAD